MNSQRLETTLKILRLLQTGTVTSAGDLAEMFGCSRRTIFRHIQLLRNNDIAIHYNAAKGGYQVLNPPRATNLSLNTEELGAVAIAVLAPQFAQLPPYAALSREGAGKLLNKIPEAEKNRIRKIAKIVSDERAPIFTETRMKDFLTLLIEAASEQVPLKLYVLNAEDSSAFSTRCNIKRLILTAGGWHLLARSSHHQGLARIALVDILSIKKLKKKKHPQAQRSQDSIESD